MMTNTPQEYHFKNKNKLALDNNALCAAIGMYGKIKTLAERRRLSLDDAFDCFSVDSEYLNANLKHRAKLKMLFNNLKLAWKKELRLVITPTVRSEIFDKKIVFSQIKPNVFFHDFWVEHTSLDESQELIDELTHDLLSSHPVTYYRENGHTYTKKECPIEGNHNENHDHDARIFAESIFIGSHLFTFDSDFDNREQIYATVEEFEKKHPETQGISKFKILPEIQKFKSQDKKFER